MSTRGQIPWKQIQKMLGKCTDGWRFVDKTHKRWVYVDGHPGSFKLPMGAHGSRNPEIEIGHVRGMARHFEITDCAKQQLEQLR